MKNGLVIADSGPIFSLALIDKLNILDSLFDEVKIPQAVWEEITFDSSKSDYQTSHQLFVIGFYTFGSQKKPKPNLNPTHEILHSYPVPIPYLSMLFF